MKFIPDILFLGLVTWFCLDALKSSVVDLSQFFLKSGKENHPFAEEVCTDLEEEEQLMNLLCICGPITFGVVLYIFLPIFEQIGKFADGK